MNQCLNGSHHHENTHAGYFLFCTQCQRLSCAMSAATEEDHKIDEVSKVYSVADVTECS